VAVEYLRRDDDHLVIHFRLTEYTVEGVVWWIHDSEDARVSFRDRDGKSLGEPSIQEFPVPEAFQKGDARTHGARLIVPCPKRAAQVEVELGQSGLRTKWVPIPPQPD